MNLINRNGLLLPMGCFLTKKPIFVKRSVLELLQDASDILRGLSEGAK